MRAFILRRVGLLAHGQGDATLIGSTHSAGTLRLQEFFTRNGHPYTYLDVERDPSVQDLLDRFHVGVGDVPVVICRGEVVLKNPTNEEVAECFGLNRALDPATMRDVVVVGAGPAGLAAAVYAALRGARRAGARGQRSRRASRNQLKSRTTSGSRPHEGAGATGTDVEAGGGVGR